MAYKLEISEEADKKFRKLSKKNKKQLEIINKKINEILKQPDHYKPLKGDLHGARRVHIGKHFVLIYEFKNNTVRILDYNHHDKIY